MTAQIETIFTSSVYHNNLNFNLKKFCLDIQKTKNQNNRSGVNSWQSENIINDLPKDFLNCLNDEVNNYKNFLNVKKKVIVEYVWLNVNKKGSYNLEHDHPNCFISGVYYINTPINSGDIIFKHPSPTIDYVWPDENCFEQYNEFNSAIWTVKAEKNKLLLFPSWLRHRVEENKNNEDRISISFNCVLS